MLSKIDEGSGASLRELDLTKGIVGFDCFLNSYPFQGKFILALPNEWGTSEDLDSDREYSVLNLGIMPRENTPLTFLNLFCRGLALSLYVPQKENSRRILLPDTHFLTPSDNLPNLVRHAYSGKDEITYALENHLNEDMRIYSEWICGGNLIVQRTDFETFLEKTRFKKYLPNQLRFKRGTFSKY